MRNGRTWNEVLHGDGGRVSIVGGPGNDPNAALAGTNFVFDPVLNPAATRLLGYKLKWQAGS